VEVLLATYNGEKYLIEQLDSLIAQVGVSISLLVSDDGSEDKTLQILNFYKSKIANMKILKGPRMGVKANFFYLLSQSKGKIVALCDQDDIWDPEHLKKSIARLAHEKPSLTFSSVREFNAVDPAKFSVWPKKLRIHRIENILFENPARGCTMVMNREFVEIVETALPDNAIMHDWWIALVGVSYNCISGVKTPEIKYRVHSHNAIGPTPGLDIRAKRFKKIIKGGSLPAIPQIRALSEIHGSNMTNQSRKALSIWVPPIGLGNLLNQIFCLARYRFNIIDEMILRLMFTWVWLRRKVDD
jgi:glycosyltransferase involved in cell wall biosynthesis